MNSPLPPRSGRLLTGLLAGLCSLGNVFAADSLVPHGSLSVDRDLVRVGTRSQLSWQIEHPSPVTSVVEIAPPGILKPKKDLKMRVRVLGTSFQRAKSNNGHGNNLDGVDSSNPGKGNGGPNGALDLSGTFDDEKKGPAVVLFPVEVSWSLNSSPWTRLFHGCQTDVNPSQLVLETTLKHGDTVNFGGRGWRDGNWLPFYSTAANTRNLVVLKNGDSVPSAVPALEGTIESFLRPYMNLSNKTVRIGDRDLILLLELGETNPAVRGFDLQDLVMLVTFE